LGHRQILIAFSGLVLVTTLLSSRVAARFRMRGLAAALDELRSRNFIADTGAAGAPREKLTSSGCGIFDRLASARRAHLSELAEEWDPSTGTNVSDYLRDAVRDLIPDSRRTS